VIPVLAGERYFSHSHSEAVIFADVIIFFPLLFFLPVNIINGASFAFYYIAHHDEDLS
jgi:hypothetical protein